MTETPAAFASNGYGTWEFIQTSQPGRFRTIYNPNDPSQTWPQTFGANIDLMLDSPSFPFWPADGQTVGKQTDSPTHQLNVNVLELDYFAFESYTAYVMYCPPGSGSQCVPVAAEDWDYSCGASRAAGGTWNPTFYPSHANNHPDPDFPTWTKFTGDYHFWVTSPPWQ